MLKSGEEILADIDATLDQLIQNAKVIRHTSLQSLCENEIEALQKTQESLLARLIHMDLLLDKEEKRVHLKKQPDAFESIQQKIAHYGKLNHQLMHNVAAKFGETKKRKKPSLRTRRSSKAGKLSKSHL